MAAVAGGSRANKEREREREEKERERETEERGERERAGKKGRVTGEEWSEGIERERQRDG